MMKRAFGRFHMLRGGKRSDSSINLLESAEDALRMQQPVLSHQMAKRGGGEGWNEFLRQLRSNAGIHRGGRRRSWFGGVHMLRSG